MDLCRQFLCAFQQKKCWKNYRRRRHKHTQLRFSWKKLTELLGLTYPIQSLGMVYGCWTKTSGSPKWMVENHEQMDDLGGKPTIFGNIHVPTHEWLMFMVNGGKFTVRPMDSMGMSSLYHFISWSFSCPSEPQEIDRCSFFPNKKQDLDSETYLEGHQVY